METTAEGVYAIGDVTNIHNLAHVASRHGVIAAYNIAGKKVKITYDAIPEAIFTDPEVGLVGMSEKMCKDKGIDYITGKFPYMSNGKALVENSTQGFVKFIAEKESRQIIGAQLVGKGAAELLSAAGNLVTNKTTIDQAQEVIYAHPTISEVLAESILDLEGLSIHKSLNM